MLKPTALTGRQPKSNVRLHMDVTGKAQFEVTDHYELAERGAFVIGMSEWQVSQSNMSMSLTGVIA